MAHPYLAGHQELPGILAATEMVTVVTERPLQLLDITGFLVARVRRSGVEHGILCVQTLHTTTGIAVNEDEPLLASDLERALERLVPREHAYAHDDLARRVAVPAGERANGHAHCKALLLAPSATLTVVAGRLVLGRWQRVFLVELDGGRRRSLSIVVLGTGRNAGPCAPDRGGR